MAKEIVRCRWTRDQPGALWVGDFEHGPPVMHQGRSVKTHLSAWIDCHSRYIVEARYYVRENLDILLDSLLRAWEITAPAANCTWTTPKSTMPRPCNWPAPSSTSSSCTGRRVILRPAA